MGSQIVGTDIEKRACSTATASSCQVSQGLFSLCIIHCEGHVLMRGFFFFTVTASYEDQTKECLAAEPHVTLVRDRATPGIPKHSAVLSLVPHGYEL